MAHTIYYKYIDIRKILSWSAIHKMKIIRNEKMKNRHEIRNVKEIINPILLYDSECWTFESIANLRMLYQAIYNCHTQI